MIDPSNINNFNAPSPINNGTTPQFQNQLPQSSTFNPNNKFPGFGGFTPRQQNMNVGGFSNYALNGISQPDQNAK